MNKIYNNLTIENIIKTDWFNQFESFQKNEIYRGLQENLDVFKYAKTEIFWKKMKKIRKELLKESTQL